MATILDVAREAGVGVGTVSRVINGHARVAADTRTRVLAVIERLNYSPNPSARSLSTGRTTAICVLVPFLTSASVNARLVGVVEALGESGREIILRVIDSVEQRDQAIDSILGGPMPAGLLVISLPLDAQTVQRLKAADIAVVAVDVTLANVPSVTIDNAEGGYQATKYLLDRGHRAIAFIGDSEVQPLGFTSSVSRQTGYLRALAEAGISPRYECVKTGSFGRASAHQMTQELLALATPPTAIFAASDTQAFGVLESIRAHGLRVPEDISVIGYDDIELAPYVGLTSVHQPLVESGKFGAEALLVSLEGAFVEDIDLATSIVERTSVASR